MIFKKEKTAFDYLIVGLGNIGMKYEGTRHNVGFACVDTLSTKVSFKPYKNKFKAEITECMINGNRCLVAKPTTFMNLSGEAVAEIIKFYKIPIEKVIVISDDVDTEQGRIRIRKSGNHGGQNGLRNIIDMCGSNNFPRVRIGIGRSGHPDFNMVDWVLSCYKGEEGEKVKSAINNAADAVISIITDGIDKAMTKYNRQVL